MWSLGVEPDQVFHEDDVELLWLQELVSVVVHKLLLDGTVEPLAVSIHLRGPGVRVVMREMQFGKFLGEVLLELRSVVREDELERHRENHATKAKEFLRSLRSMGGGAPRKPEPAVEILEGDDISPAAMNEPLHGIEGNAVAGVRRCEILRLAHHLLTIHPPHFPIVTDLLRKDPETS